MRVMRAMKRLGIDRNAEAVALRNNGSRSMFMILVRWSRGLLEPVEPEQRGGRMKWRIAIDVTLLAALIACAASWLALIARLL